MELRKLQYLGEVLVTRSNTKRSLGQCSGSSKDRVSGKSASSNAKGGGSSPRKKKVAKRQSGADDLGATVFNDENKVPLKAFVPSSSSSSSMNIAAQNALFSSSNPCKGEVKKLEISVDEKHMNGAPEGDLYDITVLEDKELNPLDMSKEDCTKFLQETLGGIHTESTSWADRFTAVEIIRRVMNTPAHVQIVVNDYVLLSASLESCMHAIGCLRSCSVRNGILALRALVSHVPAVVEQENAYALVSSLMNAKLIASGPRFIRESTVEVIQEASERMQPFLAVESFRQSLGHKSFEVSSLASRIIGESVQRLALQECDLQRYAPSAKLEEGEEHEQEEKKEKQVKEEEEENKEDKEDARETGEGEEEGEGGEEGEERDGFMTTNSQVAASLHDQQLVMCTQCLYQGLSARKPQARETSRVALSYLQRGLGSNIGDNDCERDIFEYLVRESLEQHQVIELHREVSKYYHSNSSASITTTSTTSTALKGLEGLEGFSVQGQGMIAPMAAELSNGSTGSRKTDTCVGVGASSTIVAGIAGAEVEIKSDSARQPKHRSTDVGGKVSSSRTSSSSSSSSISGSSSNGNSKRAGTVGAGRISLKEQMRKRKAQMKKESGGGGNSLPFIVFQDE